MRCDKLASCPPRIAPEENWREWGNSRWATRWLRCKVCAVAAAFQTMSSSIKIDRASEQPASYSSTAELHHGWCEFMQLYFNWAASH